MRVEEGVEKMPGCNAVRPVAAAILAAVLLLGACSAPVPAPAESGNWDADFDDEKKAWKEIEATLPRYPKPESLLPFEAAGASPHQFFIDAESLAIGADGVVRYTLVVKTAGGASNVTYEGIRCDERHQKTYAVGQLGGGWVRARNPQWRRMEAHLVNNHHLVLWGDFLCRNKQPATSVQEVIEKLKYARWR